MTDVTISLLNARGCGGEMHYVTILGIFLLILFNVDF